MRTQSGGHAESPEIPAARAALADAFVAGTRVLDLGSGAGFPALILAAACDADFLLMEARRKRASFLRLIAAEMGLANVQVDSARAEPATLRSAHNESSRAEGKPSLMVDVESALTNTAALQKADETSHPDPAPSHSLLVASSRDQAAAAQGVRGGSSRTDAVALPKIQDPSHGETAISRREGAEFSGADAEASQMDRIESSRTDTVALPKIRTDSSRGKTEAARWGFDVVTARAFAEPAIVFETAAAALREGGRVVLYASAAQREEIERASAAMFDPPVFLPYNLKHASTVTVAGAPRIGSTGDASGPTVNIIHAATGTVTGSSGRNSDSSTGGDARISTGSDTHAAAGTVAGSSGSISDGSTGGDARASTGGDARISTGSVPHATNGGIARGSTGGVVHMLAICHRR
jgi:16S rRNA G527 N7-methylase RsmG